MTQQTDPNQVPITYTMNLPQVNLLLEGLGKLPFERVEPLYTGIRSVALQTLKEAEEAAKAKLEPVEVPAE